jgi:hypothetical protein
MHFLSGGGEDSISSFYERHQSNSSPNMLPVSKWFINRRLRVDDVQGGFRMPVKI